MIRVGPTPIIMRLSLDNSHNIMSKVKRFCDGKNHAKATVKDKEQN